MWVLHSKWCGVIGTHFHGVFDDESLLHAAAGQVWKEWVGKTRDLPAIEKCNNNRLEWNEDQDKVYAVRCETNKIVM